MLCMRCVGNGMCAEFYGQYYGTILGVVGASLAVVCPWQIRKGFIKHFLADICQSGHAPTGLKCRDFEASLLGSAVAAGGLVVGVAMLVDVFYWRLVRQRQVLAAANVENPPPTKYCSTGAVIVNAIGVGCLGMAGMRWPIGAAMSAVARACRHDASFFTKLPLFGQSIGFDCQNISARDMMGHWATALYIIGIAFILGPLMVKTAELEFTTTFPRMNEKENKKT